MSLRPRLRSFAIIALILAGMLACSFFIIQRNATELARFFFENVSRQTGLVVQAEDVRLTLFPKPGISASNVSVCSAGLEFSVAFVSFRPDFSSLLCGRLEPASLVMFRPKVKGKMLQDDKKQNLENIDTSYLISLIWDCRLDISQGSLDLYMPGNLHIMADGINLHLKSGFWDELQGNIGLLSLLVENGQIRHPGLTHLNAKFGLHRKNNSWYASSRVKGAIVKDRALIPFELDCQEISKNNDQTFNLKSLAIALGEDSAMLDAGIAMPDNNDRFSVDGRMKIVRLSLTRWLGFARDLAPGLQIALDNLVEGSMDFHLDEKGLDASEIKVVCSGASFYGRGGVASWGKPVVFLDLASQYVNLGLGIPEAVGRAPARPWFEHRPLTSWSEKYEAEKVSIDALSGNDAIVAGAVQSADGKIADAKAGSSVFEIGYDIRLSASKVDYGPLSITDAKTFIAPSKKDKNGNTDAIVTAKANLCQGSMSGECVIGGDDTTTYGIKVSLKNLNGTDIAKAFPMLPVASGQFNSDIAVTSQGSDLDSFLANLRGKAVLHGEHGQIGQPGGNDRIPFSNLNISYAVNSSVWKANRLGLKGHWQASLVNKDFAGQASADGSLWFYADSGGGSMDFNNLPGKLRLVLSRPSLGLPAGLDLEGGGLFSFSGGKGVISVNNGKFHCLGLDIDGNLRLESGKGLKNSNLWQGRVDIRSNNLASTLSKTGLSVNVPAFVSSIKLSTDFRYSVDNFDLERIQTRIGQTNIGGSIAVSLKNSLPHFTFSLRADKFDFDNLKKSLASRYVKGKKNTAVRETDWNFPIMRLFSAKGELKIGNIHANVININDAKIPLELSSGVLTMGRSTASAYRSTLEARGKFDFNKGLASQVVFSINDFDLGSVFSDKRSKARLEGRALVGAKLSSSLSGRAKLMPSLSGTWQFRIADGSYQNFSDSGKPKGKLTKFDLATATGSMSSGIARSNNFLLKGDGLKAGGGGWIDFGKETMDINLDVDMRSVPKFPMRIYGSFDRTQTSIGAGRMILNAIGGVTQGFVNVIGGIGEGLWKVFR